MRLAYGQVRNVDKEILINAGQMGIDRVRFNLSHDLPADELWEYEDLTRFRDVCGRYGVIAEVMENVPISFYDKVMLGLEERDRQIENVCGSTRSLGRMGIPVLGCHSSPSSVWGTDNHAPVGWYGATVWTLDLGTQKQGVDDVDDLGQRRDTAVPDVELLRENFEYFMKWVIPVAGEYSATVALYPGDSPVKSPSSITRTLTDLDSYKRAEATTDSPNWGLLFYIRTLSQVEGGAGNIFDATEYLGPRRKLVHMHIRDVRETMLKFQECSLRERNLDPFEVVYRLIHSGFDGFLVSGHVPGIEGDKEWGYKVRYADTAYIKDLVGAIEEMEAARQVQKNLWMIYCVWIKDEKEG